MDYKPELLHQMIGQQQFFPILPICHKIVFVTFDINGNSMQLQTQYRISKPFTHKLNTEYLNIFRLGAIF